MFFFSYNSTTSVSAGMIHERITAINYKLNYAQAGVIQCNLNARTGKYCGEMGVDYWDASKWVKELAEHDVIVCTAKIMENLLHMAYITMDKVSYYFIPLLLLLILY